MARFSILLLAAVALVAGAAALPVQPKDTFVHAPFSNIISSENNPVAAFIPDNMANGYTIPDGYMPPHIHPNPEYNGDDNGNDNGDDDDDTNQ